MTSQAEVLALPFGDHRITRANASVISGGLSGGEVPLELTAMMLMSTYLVMEGTTVLIYTLSSLGLLLSAPVVFAVVVTILIIANLVFEMYTSYYDYLENGDLDDYINAEDKAGLLTLIGSLELMTAQYLLAYKMVASVSGRSESGEQNDSIKWKIEAIKSKSPEQLIAEG